jgi:hypothetical protein
LVSIKRVSTSEDRDGIPQRGRRSLLA